MKPTLIPPDGIAPGYITTDFYFTAYALAQDDISLLGLRPYTHKPGSNDTSVRFEFVLGLSNEDGNAIDPRPTLEAMRMKFISRLAMVEPLAYNGIKDSLRSALTVAIKEVKKEQRNQQQGQE